MNAYEGSDRLIGHIYNAWWVPRPFVMLTQLPVVTAAHIALDECRVCAALCKEGGCQSCRGGNDSMSEDESNGFLSSSDEEDEPAGMAEIS